MVFFRKQTRFLVSCLTFVLCFSMLGMVIRAQGIEVLAADQQRVEHTSGTSEVVTTRDSGTSQVVTTRDSGTSQVVTTRDSGTSQVVTTRDSGTSEVVTTNENDLIAHLSVLSQTAIAFGDEMTYRLVISNHSQESVSGVTMTAPIPYGARFNFISRGSPTFTYHVTDNQVQISPTTGITLAAGESQSLEFVVDTTAACGTSVVNEVTLNSGGKSTTSQSTAMAWDRIHASYNFEGITSTTESVIPGVNLFSEASGDWEVGPVVSPAFLGAASGKQVWGTNLSGATRSQGEQVLKGTLDLTGFHHLINGSNQLPLYLTWQEYFEASTSSYRGKVYVGDELIHQVDRRDFIETQGYKQQAVDIQRFAGQEVELTFVFEGPPNNPHDSGWYIDDVAVTQCDLVRFDINKVASIDPTATCDMTTSNNEDGSQGLILNEESDVYYCYAIENRGNVTLTEHLLTDDVLGDIITRSNQFIVPPGVVTNTVSHGITVSQKITQNTVNTAIWRARTAGFYQIVTDTNVTFTDIMTRGTRLEIKDDSEITATIPFAFNFFEKRYPANSKVVVGNNGGLLFANPLGLSDVPPENTALPLTGPQGIQVPELVEGQAIFPFWDDLESGLVFTYTQGSRPNRKFIFQWSKMPHQNTPYTATITFQAILYERSNNIAFVYKDVAFGNQNFDYGASATVGLNESQSNALQYSFNRAALSDAFQIRFIRHLRVTDTETVYLKVPAIKLSATVGSDPNNCTTSNTITVTVGTTVYYCFSMTNDGNTTFDTHTLVDHILGINQTFNQIVPPGETINTQIALNTRFHKEITTDTINISTWTASNQLGDSVTTSASATVHLNRRAPLAVEIAKLYVSSTDGPSPPRSLAAGMLLLVTGGYVIHRRRKRASPRRF